MRRSAPVTTACLLVAAFAAAGAARSSGDPGLRLELDRQRFELALTDLRGGLAGPRFRVATGSPLHPTPDGVYALHQVVRRPAWRPGSAARAATRLP